MQRTFLVSVLILFVLPFAGCKKKEAAADVTEQSAARAKGKEVLPGASDVRAALAKKDYSGAVGGLVALKAFAATQEQIIEYNNVYGEVKSTLMEAAQTDAKANEALMTLRAATSGR